MNVSLLYKLSRRNAISYVGCFALASIATSILVGYIIYAIEIKFGLDINENAGPLSKSSIGEKLLLACFIGPLVETFLFQYLVIEIMKKKTKKINTVLISALLFSLSHFYSAIYMFRIFFVGVYLALSYICWKREKPSAFFVTNLVHSCYNLVVFILDVSLG